jgi:hypothetical protein
MGRGLSELQKCILRLALKNREREQRRNARDSGADVYLSEVLVEYFGFERDPDVFWGSKEPLRERLGTPKFSKATIRAKRYEAAQAALSRAALRLQERAAAYKKVLAYLEKKERKRR